MKKILFLGFLVGGVLFTETGEATFSIVAVDPCTGQVGSAGASCIANSQILNDVIGAIGGINTQSFYRSGNQLYAHSLMEQGLSPQEIIDSLVANDIDGDPTARQYGIVDFVGGGRSAAFTGINCIDWKGHLTGTTYAIQGNILLGPEILDTMEVIFNSTPGPLSDRLMAALEAAKIPGADIRCLLDGKSSISAFIHVVLPDSTDFPYLIVSDTPLSVDPIDSLRVLYDTWRSSIGCASFDELDQKISLADIENEGIRNSLESKAKNARKQFNKCKLNTCGNVLCALLHELDAQEGKHIDPSSAQEIRDCVRTLASNLGIHPPCVEDDDDDGENDDGSDPQNEKVGKGMETFSLFKISPNPFRSGTTIRFSLPEKTHATLTIHDVTGRTVATLVDREFGAGFHAVEWNGDATAGIYFYRLQVRNFVQTKKMVLLR